MRRSGIRTLLVLLAFQAPLPPLALATLQEDIDAASPGEVVLVAPGDYPRTITAHKAITIRPSGPGIVRFAGFEGSGCRVEEIVFDGELGADVSALVKAGEGLTLAGCTLTSAVRGLFVEGGSGGVLLDSCLLADIITGIELGPDVGSFDLVGTMFLECTRALIDEASEDCPAPCEEGSCGRIRIEECRFEGGEVQVRLLRGYEVLISKCVFTGGERAVSLAHASLDLQSSDLLGNLRTGEGLALQSVSGQVARCRIRSWDTAIRVAEAPCGPSTFVLGGSTPDANDIEESNLGLLVVQPEAIDAEYNYWGTTDCTLLAFVIDGQDVETILDDRHQSFFICPPTPVERTTWGRLRAGVRR